MSFESRSQLGYLNSKLMERRDCPCNSWVAVYLEKSRRWSYIVSCGTLQLFPWCHCSSVLHTRLKDNSGTVMQYASYFFTDNMLSDRVVRSYNGCWLTIGSNILSSVRKTSTVSSSFVMLSCTLSVNMMDRSLVRSCGRWANRTSQITAPVPSYTDQMQFSDEKESDF